MDHINSTQGCEVHRLTEFTHYDKKMFNTMYHICRPVINRLSNNIDYRKLGVTKDIVQSYFWDKFLLVYNKYQDLYDENRLKATLLASLKTYRKRLLRCAYSEMADFNSITTYIEDDYEKAHDEDDGSQLTEYKEELSVRFHKWMREHLTDNEYILFKTQLTLPPFLADRSSLRGKLSIKDIIDYFGMPRDARSKKLISYMRRNINSALELAKTEFKR